MCRFFILYGSIIFKFLYQSVNDNNKCIRVIVLSYSKKFIKEVPLPFFYEINFLYR